MKNLEIAQRAIYHAADVVADKSIHEQIQLLQAADYGRFPVCVAKTQYPFTQSVTTYARASIRYT